MFKILKSRKDLTDDDIPLKIFGARMCSRCQDVKAALEAAGVAHEAIEVAPGADMYRGLERHHAATLLAVFTLQDELLPAVIGADWESCVFEKDVERFLR